MYTQSFWLETRKWPNRYIHFLIFDDLTLQFTRLQPVARRLLTWREDVVLVPGIISRAQSSFKELVLWWRTSFPYNLQKRSWSCIWTSGADSSRQTGLPGLHLVPSKVSPMPALLTSPSAVIFVTTAFAVVYFRPIKVLFASLLFHYTAKSFLGNITEDGNTNF